MNPLPPQFIESHRLRLFIGTPKVLDAAIAGDAQLAALTTWQIPKNWSEFKEMTFPYVKDQMQENPSDATWWTYLPVLKEGNVLIGCCGYKGGPNPAGSVEIGYEIATRYRGQGFALEIAQALIQYAFSKPQVKRVAAHTLAAENASVHILRRCGMNFKASLLDPDDGQIWAWEMEKPQAIQGHIPNSRLTAYHLGIETARLQSRPLELSDAKAWESFLGDKEATRFLPLNAAFSNAELAFHWMQRQRGRYAIGTFGLQALIDKNSGEFVGQSGLLGQVVEGNWELEVGYHIFPKHWRKGYATEAAKGYMNWANAHGFGEGIISLIEVSNHNSQAVALKNGLKPDFRTKMMGLDIQVYRDFGG